MTLSRRRLFRFSSGLALSCAPALGLARAGVRPEQPSRALEAAEVEAVWPMYRWEPRAHKWSTVTAGSWAYTNIEYVRR